jgi:Rab GDP dissociation inhibitor
MSSATNLTCFLSTCCCAGTYMLNKPVAEIVYDSNGVVCGVKDTEGATAKCKQVICDPSYVLGTDLIRQVGKIVRCIAIMSHPIPDTNNADSCQIIIPAHQIKGRHSDIYVSCVSYHHKVVASGKWVAVISANLEGKDEKTEIEPAMKLLGGVDETFLWVSDNYVPTQDGTKNQVFVTSSYDATSHFETATDEVLALYEKIMGKAIDLAISAEPDDLQEQ